MEYRNKLDDKWKPKEYIPILDAGENIGFSASSSLAKGTNKKPTTLKSSGRIKLKEKLITRLLN